MLKLKCDKTKGYNIRRIKPYKSDNIVEDSKSIKCLMMSEYDGQLYTFVLNIETWKQNI